MWNVNEPYNWLETDHRPMKMARLPSPHSRIVNSDIHYSWIMRPQCCLPKKWLGWEEIFIQDCRGKRLQIIWTTFLKDWDCQGTTKITYIRSSSQGIWEDERCCKPRREANQFSMNVGGRPKTKEKVFQVEDLVQEGWIRRSSLCTPYTQGWIGQENEKKGGRKQSRSKDKELLWNPWSKENCGLIRCFPFKSDGG